MPIYLQFDGISGDSTNPLHPHTFECTSFSWGASSHGGSSSGGGAGRTTFEPVSATMPLESRTVELMLACVTRRRFANVYLFDTLNHAEHPLDVQSMHFTNVIITGWSESSSGDLPAVQMTFEYQRVLVVSQFPNADGRLQSDEVTWDTQLRGG